MKVLLGESFCRYPFQADTLGKSFIGHSCVQVLLCMRKRQFQVFDNLQFVSLLILDRDELCQHLGTFIVCGILES